MYHMYIWIYVWTNSCKCLHIALGKQMAQSSCDCVFCWILGRANPPILLVWLSNHQNGIDNTLKKRLGHLYPYHFENGIVSETMFNACQG